MSKNLTVKCQYCHSTALGINYRPRPQLQNAPACDRHRSSLFVPYADTVNSSKGPFASISAEVNERQLKNEEFFEQLMGMVVGQYNQLKAEVRNCEDKLKKLDQNQTYGFQLPCKVTNPYMLLREDKEMMLNTLLSRIKRKFQSERRGGSGLKDSRCQSAGRPSPFMKNSMMTVVSSSHKSEYASPKNKLGEDGNFFKKLDDVKL